MSKTQKDISWESIFDKHKILEKISSNGRAIISATEINEEGTEARLMTKIDHKSQLPKLFSTHNLSILPISRGKYVIGKFETFCDFNTDDVEITRSTFPSFLESLNYRDITSEATAVNCAFVSNILQDFTEEDLLPTVSGRMSSSSFNFNINSTNGLFNIDVNNSQIEIDGGFEGNLSLNLIEAKNYISDDFIVRQLYYPYRLWKSKISKKVRPIFLTYTNGIFHLREYAFDDIDHYNSIRLVKQKKYAVQDGAVNIETIQEIIDTVEIVSDLKIPFPQANSFERVINLCELLKQKGFMSKEEITQNYDFDSRQTDYYLNAGKYLGLIETGRHHETNQTGCYLSAAGNQLFNKVLIDRQMEYIKLILSHAVFRETLKQYFETGEMPSRNSIVEIMRRSNLYNVQSDETYSRRASTITGWINWIMNQIEE
jgi:hypothetical protein